MVTNLSFIKKAIAFEEAEEQPHFEKRSFRINKKIFATLNEPKRSITVKLAPLDQSVFCSYKKDIIYPATGNWGKQGWTIIDLTKIPTAMLDDVLTTAYCTVAPRRLADKYREGSREA